MQRHPLGIIKSNQFHDARCCARTHPPAISNITQPPTPASDPLTALIAYASYLQAADRRLGPLEPPSPSSSSLPSPSLSGGGAGAGAGVGGREREREREETAGSRRRRRVSGQRSLQEWCKDRGLMVRALERLNQVSQRVKSGRQSMVGVCGPRFSFGFLARTPLHTTNSLNLTDREGGGTQAGGALGRLPSHLQGKQAHTQHSTAQHRTAPSTQASSSSPPSPPSKHQHRTCVAP